MKSIEDVLREMVQEAGGSPENPVAVLIMGHRVAGEALRHFDKADRESVPEDVARFYEMFTRLRVFEPCRFPEPQWKPEAARLYHQGVPVGRVMPRLPDAFDAGPFRWVLFEPHVTKCAARFEDAKADAEHALATRLAAAAEPRP